MQHFRFGGFTGAVATLVVLMGLLLAGGGGWLLVLGGSPYYVAAGFGLLLTGSLLLRRSRWALWCFAALLAATLIWAVLEVGLDWWPLAARIDVFSVLGLVLMLPWVTRSLRGRAPASLRRGGGLALSTVVVAAALLSVVAAFTNPHDLAGELPPSQGALKALGEPVRGVPEGEWHAYGRTGYGQRYSPLREITTANVAQLEVAWQFHTGDVRGRLGDPVETTDEVTPLKVGDKLFLCTPHQSVIALDATTGAQVWRYEPKVSANLALQHLTCRGLSYQPPPAGMVTASACAAKLFMPTADGRLIALDPASGAVCTAFGSGRGQIDLWAGMPNHRPGSYYSTSPVVVTEHLVIVGDARAVRRHPRLRHRHRRTGVELGLGPPGRHHAAGRRRALHGQLAQQLVDLQRRRDARHGLRADGQPAA